MSGYESPVEDELSTLERLVLSRSKNVYIKTSLLSGVLDLTAYY